MCFQAEVLQILCRILNEEGIHPTNDKVEAIQNAPVPHNAQQLRSYLGLIPQFHEQHQQHPGTVTYTSCMVRFDNEWKWGAIHQNAFEQSKALLYSSKVLAHDGNGMVVLGIGFTSTVLDRSMIACC